MRLDSFRLNSRMALLAGSAIVAMAVVAAAMIGWRSITRTSSPGTTETSAPRRDLGWLQKAMDECEQQAARAPDSLLFLVIPLVPADNDYARWNRRAISSVGTGGAFLGSKDMLEGVTSGALVPYHGHFKFMVTDEVDKTKTYTWPITNGVFQFAIPSAPTMDAFFLSFQMVDNEGQMQISRTPFPRSKGSCYWTSLLLATPRTKL
jgi:hypothetical protein